MKNIAILGFFLFSVAAFGQEELRSFVPQPENNNTQIIEDQQIICIIRVPKTNLISCDFDCYTRAQIIQPTKTNELPVGTMPISEDLPMVQTIRGTVYSFDHIRTQARN